MELTALLFAHLRERRVADDHPDPAVQFDARHPREANPASGSRTQRPLDQKRDTGASLPVSLTQACVLGGQVFEWPPLVGYPRSRYGARTAGSAPQPA